MLLEVRPTGRASDAIKAIDYCAREASNVIGGRDNDPDRILSAYRTWASNSLRMLTPWISDEAIRLAVTTTRYWSLLNLDTSSFTRGDLAAYVIDELSDRSIFLNQAVHDMRLELARWTPLDPHGTRSYDLAAIVPDTNVLVAYWDQLRTFDWQRAAGVPRWHHVGLAVPIQVIRELDRHKMAARNDVNRGTKDSLRERARFALREIETRIVDPAEAAIIRSRDLEADNDPGEVRLLLIADRIPGEPLADADAEIVDRAASLLPYAHKVHLLSYDAAIVFRSRLAGVPATKLVHEWDNPGD